MYVTKPEKPYLKQQFSKMTERERIGALIASTRKEKGLTQDDLAVKCGMQKQNISRIEHGKYSIGIEILAKVCKAMGCKLDIISE